VSARAPVLIALVVGLASGCGGSKHAASASRPVATTASTKPDAAVVLTRAVRNALNENHRLATKVLWRNVVPSAATHSTRGPALASLRAAAANRQRRGIRVRLLSDDYRILSVRLDPSFASATAIARGLQRVRPYGPDGHPLGHAVSLNEKARIELHRLGHANRFVVWRVTLVR
jgi:hypothetical protein